MGRDFDRLSKEQLVATVRALEKRLRDDEHLKEAVAELRMRQEEVRMQQQLLLEAQNLLEASRDRYADLFDFAPVAYVTLDRNGVVLDMNFQASTLLDIDRGRAVGLPLLMRTAPGDRGRFLDHMRRCREQTSTVRTELELRGRAGNIVPVEMASRPWGGTPDTQPVFHTMLVDLTERRANERARREADLDRERLAADEQAARAAGEAKDRFLAVLSHELRTPLAPIFFALDALEARLGDEAGVRPTIDVIRRNVRMEADLIDDLLDVTRIAHGKLHLTCRPVELRDILEETLVAVRSSSQAANRELAVELGDARHWVHGDPTRLRQVFGNLLDNAVRHTPRGGVVRLEVTASPGEVRVAVTDTGGGFAPEQAEALFEPFVQGERGEGGRSGLGLGLAISKGLVEAHGGTIAAHSDGPGRGARFVVCLPAVDAPDPHALVPVPVLVRPMRVLLVEDHADTASALAEVLRLEGHGVVVAASVAEALALDVDAFDVVVSDLGLPDASGCDLLRALRRRRAVPAIALSGYGTSDDLQRSAEAGFQQHLVKPVDTERLVQAIAAVAAS
jgi:PAS domain S-box-containing protein